MSRIWYFSADVFLALAGGAFYWMSSIEAVAPPPVSPVSPPAIAAHPVAQPADPFKAERAKPDVDLPAGVWVSQAEEGARLVLRLRPERQYALSVSIPTGGKSEFKTDSQGTYIVQGATVKFMANSAQGIFPQLGETRIVRQARDTLVLETRTRHIYVFEKAA